LESTENKVELLKEQIKNLSAWLWGYTILDKDVELWLSNFNISENQREDYIPLLILSQFMFYEQREVRQALKSLYKDHYIAPLVSKYRSISNSYNLNEYENFINEKLRTTRFSNIGNPSESSSMLLYYFRQRNNIDKELFVDSCQLLTSAVDNENVEYLIYLDDLSGSGSQATGSLETVIKDIRAKIKNIKISYFTLFATTKALKTLIKSNLFDDVGTVFELDETYRIFSEESRYFDKKEAADKKKFEEICKNEYKSKWELGKEDISRNKDKSLNKDECGFGNTQLGLGFFYNVPNNTLPIFWAESDNWEPIFKRYSKQYAIFKKDKNV